MKRIFYFLILCIAFYSCKSNNSEKDNSSSKSNVTPKTYDYGHIEAADSNKVQDGEMIKRYPNGVIKMRGVMKAGKRDGPWQSWYDNGLEWSESIYDNGVKNGKTATWFPNGQKRYDGYYTNDKPSGTWNYYNEAGKKINTQTYKTE